MIVGDRGGTKDNWCPGEEAWFEYHCQRSHESADAELWYRDHEAVIVMGIDGDEDPELDTLAKRGAEAMPRTYQVKFIDGHEGVAVEDELLVSREFFDPALGPPPKEEIAAKRKHI